MVKKVLTGILVFFFSASLALAVEVGGIDLAESLETEASTLVLNGAGVRKKFGFKVYVGGLYLKAKTKDSKQIISADEPMAITMTWKRTGPVDKVKGVYADGFKYGAGENYDSLKAEIDEFLNLTVKAEKGDVWKYVYMPGKGVSVDYNGNVVKTFSNFEFKKALFSIWLLTSSEFQGDFSLRNGMLGR